MYSETLLGRAFIFVMMPVIATLTVARSCVRWGTWATLKGLGTGDVVLSGDGRVAFKRPDHIRP